MSETIYSRSRTPDYTMDGAPNAEITLYGMAELLLNRARQAFEERGVLLPGRQLIYLSPIPADCEQLAILISGWVPMPPWEGITHCQRVKWCGQFDIIVTRATPAMPKGSKAPTVEQMNLAAQIASEDAECVLRVVQGLEEIGETFSLEMNAPQGGFQTTACNLLLPAYGALE